MGFNLANLYLRLENFSHRFGGHYTSYSSGSQIGSHNCHDQVFAQADYEASIAKEKPIMPINPEAVAKDISPAVPKTAITGI